MAPERIYDGGISPLSCSVTKVRQFIFISTEPRVNPKKAKTANLPIRHEMFSKLKNSTPYASLTE